MKKISKKEYDKFQKLKKEKNMIYEPENYSLEELKTLRDKLRSNINFLNLQVALKFDRILKEKGIELDKKYEYIYPWVGHWSCKKSPIAVCVYDDWNDGIHDECIFCGNPEERK